MFCFHRLGLRAAAALIVGLGIATSAQAEFPDRPIQFVSPYAAGGANDFLTRLMAQHMGDELKTTIVVDNRAGANGVVGASFVAKAQPDGYTVLMGNSATHGTNPTLYPDVTYDPVKDFAPIGMVGSVPIVLAVNAKLNVRTVAELIAYGKANPSKLSYGSSGIGGTGHLAGEAFNAAAGLDMVHVPYKGDAPAAADAMGGQVSMAFVGVASAASMLQSGKIRILAVASPKRSSSLPDVPTLEEAGFKGLYFAQWYALFTRAGTPAATIEKLNGALKLALARSDVKKAMASQGADAAYTTPAALNTFYRSEVKRFGEIIHRLNIKATN
ncbi:MULTISPECIES: Bug family tripartite tricarboxylate transporter substrate binding protein [Cupriavidus]|uniref:Bug family tripartite tricarboxylate transporter substrate binding protein n=1 Tax=Cupriavidus sp. WS TaxID=1312922 RepID=UPI000369EB1F|nr:tripartite tricarboxylate transporter substrate binding protein [Cupriavidus sp. WS]